MHLATKYRIRTMKNTWKNNFHSSFTARPVSHKWYQIVEGSGSAGGYPMILIIAVYFIFEYLLVVIDIINTDQILKNEYASLQHKIWPF